MKKLTVAARRAEMLRKRGAQLDKEAQDAAKRAERAKARKENK